MRVAVLGSTGYTGMTLLRILSQHPQVRIIYPVSSSKAGVAFSEVDPGLATALRSRTDGALIDMADAVKAAPDIVFSALPHLTSARVCEPFFSSSVVIDLSADFRISDSALFARAYGQPPPRQDLQLKACYGLSEWYEKEIRAADIIGNPGCYPTATLLPLLPLARKGLIQGKIVVSAFSGLSGAGRKESVNLLFTERSENVNAYNPGSRHRHWSEIHFHLSRSGKQLPLLFTPHLVPIKQGLGVTTSCTLRDGVTADTVAAAFKEAYGARPFIRLLADRIPETRWVRNSNRCDIGWHVEGQELLLFSAIDNLVKGASGQAVQNMNLRFGFDESEGLRIHGEF
ncbi:MAG: N-acetyl-gamma-glutamyl-phosphate reductase [Spirochaetaceae bacterium]|nr:MAG: N-acetyl-gamma-glutamyl-phosphate reductase [Spirochaetaceae bacterium]